MISRPLRSRAEKRHFTIRRNNVLFEGNAGYYTRSISPSRVTARTFTKDKTCVLSYLDKVQNLVFFNMILLGILYTVLLEENNIWLNSTT